MSRIARLLLACAALLAFAAPALAQGNFYYRDDANLLDATKVQQAAQPLINKGALVAIYTANGGSASTFNQYMIRDGIGSNDGATRTKVIAIFIGVNPNYSAIRYGDAWKSTLGANNQYETIRTSQLNAGLRAKDPTGGVANALGALNTAIASPAAASSSDTTETSSGGAFWPWCLGILVLAIGGPLAYRAFNKRQTAGKARATAQQGYDQARKAAGGAIADALELFRDAREKAQYDKVSYPADDVAQLAAQQQQAEAAYQDAQQRYAAIEEGLRAKQTPTPEEYQQASDGYTQVVARIGEARTLLDPVSQRRAALDKINASAPEAISRAKQALSQVTEQAHTSGMFDDPAAVGTPIAQQIAQADAQLAARRGGEAAQTAEAAVAAASALASVVGRFATIREGISNGRSAAERARGQGFTIDAGLKAFDRAEATLQQAAQALQSQGSAAAIPLIDQAESLHDEGVGRGGGMAALQQANAAREPQVEQAGQQLEGLIAQGKRAFDAVDAYAESTWSDIRGNGSEAQAAATRAQQLWERAKQRNTAEQQDFYGAKQDLDAAEQEIAHARTLIESILQRLKDLETSKANAQKELAMARADIAKGRTFVQSNDADVGKAPEQALDQAEALLHQAEAEAAKPNPDWIALVKLAQQANTRADEALSQAQGEAVAMDKLREQLATAHQLAQSELQRVTQFAALHTGDFSAATTTAIQRAQQQLAQADSSATLSERAEEEARAAALREAMQRYAAVAEAAGKVYQQAYGEFEAVEKIRSQVTTEAQAAQQAIAQAERSMQVNAALIPRNSEGIQLLERAHALVAAASNVHSEAEAQQAVAHLQEARRNADSAEQLFRSYGNTIQGGTRTGSGAGDFVGGVVLGSLLGGGNNRGGGNWGGGGWSGGGGGGSSGGGGGDWGGTGGGGGDWGGGGGGGGGGW